VPSSQESGFEPGKYPPLRESSQTKTARAWAFPIPSKRCRHSRRRGILFLFLAFSAGLGPWRQALSETSRWLREWLAGRNRLPSRCFTPYIPPVYPLYTPCIPRVSNTPAIRFALAIACRCPGNGFWNSHALTVGHRCGNRIVPVRSRPLPFFGLPSSALSRTFPAIQERNPLPDHLISQVAFPRPPTTSSPDCYQNVNNFNAGNSCIRPLRFLRYGET
jgi:hypothetical protein